MSPVNQIRGLKARFKGPKKNQSNGCPMLSSCEVVLDWFCAEVAAISVGPTLEEKVFRCYRVVYLLLMVVYLHRVVYLLQRSVV